MVASVMPLMAQNWYPMFGIIQKVDGRSRLSTTILELHESVIGTLLLCVAVVDVGTTCKGALSAYFLCNILVRAPRIQPLLLLQIIEYLTHRHILPCSSMPSNSALCVSLHPLTRSFIPHRFQIPNMNWMLYLL